jgi:hypothetical protein
MKSEEKVGRNEPCPCGSGKKHKNCCWGRKDFVRDETGRVVERVSLDADLSKKMDEFLKVREEALGRPLEPGENPLLFPGETWEGVEASMSSVLKDAGINPAIIYAYEKTGFLVSAMNVKSFSNDEIREWNAALREYKAKADSGTLTPETPPL